MWMECGIVFANLKLKMSTRLSGSRYVVYATLHNNCVVL